MSDFRGPETATGGVPERPNPGIGQVGDGLQRLEGDVPLSRPPETTGDAMRAQELRLRRESIPEKPSGPAIVAVEAATGPDTFRQRLSVIVTALAEKVPELTEGRPHTARFLNEGLTMIAGRIEDRHVSDIGNLPAGELSLRTAADELQAAAPHPHSSARYRPGLTPEQARLDAKPSSPSHLCWGTTELLAQSDNSGASPQQLAEREVHKQLLEHLLTMAYSPHTRPTSKDALIWAAAHLSSDYVIIHVQPELQDNPAGIDFDQAIGIVKAHCDYQAKAKGQYNTIRAVQPNWQRAATTISGAMRTAKQEGLSY